MSLVELVTGEMLLLPGVERGVHRGGDVELRVGRKPFAHIHSPDRIDVRLPMDLKEMLIMQGVVSRHAEIHDREGWVILRVGPRLDLRKMMRVLHESYRFVSSTI